MSNPANVLDIKEGDTLELHFKVSHASRERQYHHVKRVDYRAFPYQTVIHTVDDMGRHRSFTEIEMFKIFKYVEAFHS